jgi:hypothetical protein
MMTRSQSKSGKENKPSQLTSIKKLISRKNKTRQSKALKEVRETKEKKVNFRKTLGTCVSTIEIKKDEKRSATSWLNLMMNRYPEEDFVNFFRDYYHLDDDAKVDIAEYKKKMKQDNYGYKVNRIPYRACKFFGIILSGHLEKSYNFDKLMNFHEFGYSLAIVTPINNDREFHDLGNGGNNTVLIELFSRKKKLSLEVLN